ncbi:MAG TPA: hypothetical protein VLW85_20345 [Myxococcales bacterium]|nr:hypothetical protein [Myxococcales bacterium]
MSSFRRRSLLVLLAAAAASSTMFLAWRPLAAAAPAAPVEAPRAVSQLAPDEMLHGCVSCPLWSPLSGPLR